MGCGRAACREQAEVEWEASGEENGRYVKVHSMDTSKIVKKKLKRLKKGSTIFKGEVTKQEKMANLVAFRLMYLQLSFKWSLPSLSAH